MDSPDKTHLAEELVKMHFDYFKHLTTLNGAAALVILALYQREILESDALLAALLGFGLSAGISGFGLTRAQSLLRYILCSGHDSYNYPFRTISAAFSTFAGSLSTVAVQVAAIPDWVAISAGIVLGVASLILGLIFRKVQRSH